MSNFRYWVFGALALLGVWLLIGYFNPPKPVPAQKGQPGAFTNKDVKQDKKEIAKLQKAVDLYKHKFDSAAIASKRAYQRGLQDEKEALTQSKLTHNHAPTRPTAADTSVAFMQEFFTKY